MPERRGLLCFGGFARHDWTLLWQRQQAVMTRLAGHFDVHYIERFGTRRLTVREMIRAALVRVFTRRKQSVPAAANGLHFIDPGVTPFHATHFWRHRNYVTLARAVERTWPRDLRRTVLWIYNPSYLALEFLTRTAGQWERTVYDCVQRFEFNRHYPPDIGEIDREIARRVDRVFADSRTIWEEKKRLNSNSHFIPQGVDVERFIWEGVNRALPDELRPLKRPILGYQGAWHQAFDEDLIAALIEAVADSTFVFVGPTMGRERHLRRQCPSAVFLGSRHHADLGRYVNGFDVCLIPYRLNAHTEGVFPTKFFEYVATGLPIVASDLPDLREYAQYAALARNCDEFIEKVKAAIRQSRRPLELVRPFVEQQSWDRRVEQMMELLNVGLFHLDI
jgi:glycosyltransferase involved in cell wall biosynthesis